MWIAVVAGILAVLGGTAYLVYSAFQSWRSSLLASISASARIIHTPYGPVECAIEGDGKQLVLVLHSSPGGHDQALLVAHKLFAAEPQKYTWVCPSRPGALRTPLTPGVNDSPEQQADMMAALITQLDPQAKMCVVGCGNAGHVAYEVCVRHPRLCWGCIFVSARHLPSISTPLPTDASSSSSKESPQSQSDRLGSPTEDVAALAEFKTNQIFAPQNSSATLTSRKSGSMTSLSSSSTPTLVSTPPPPSAAAAVSAVSSAHSPSRSSYSNASRQSDSWPRVLRSDLYAWMMRYEVPRMVCAYLEPRKSHQISSADALEVADTWLPRSHRWACYENDLYWYGRLHRHELHFEEFARRGLYMLVIHGTEDPVIPVEEARWALAHAPMNTHLIVENAGHLVYCDADSAELVASTVSQFCMKRPCITCF